MLIYILDEARLSSFTSVKTAVEQSDGYTEEFRGLGRSQAIGAQLLCRASKRISSNSAFQKENYSSLENMKYWLETEIIVVEFSFTKAASDVSKE